MTIADYPRDPKSPEPAPPGSVTTEYTTVTETVVYSATCPGCGRPHEHGDKAKAVRSAAACHGAVT